MHACMHAYIHTYIHAYIHSFIHTYTHTYILYVLRYRATCADAESELRKKEPERLD